MKVKEWIYSTATVLCFVGFIGTMGGFEWDMFGAIRWLLQTALFMAGMVFFHNATEQAHRATRRKRKAGNK